MIDIYKHDRHKICHGPASDEVVVCHVDQAKSEDSEDSFAAFTKHHKAFAKTRAVTSPSSSW